MKGCVALFCAYGCGHSGQTSARSHLCMVSKSTYTSYDSHCSFAGTVASFSV